MPSVAAPAKVLVTGANGFIAIWLVKELLDRGYTVRGTVRSESKGTHLLNTFKEKAEAGQFEVKVVPDITAPGAFDEVVVGMDAIEHTASPFHFNAEDPKDLIDPAVEGTTGILQSASKYAGPQLKRIVVTSSCASVANTDDTGVLDENNWNEQNIREIQEHGKDATQAAKYRASKSLAEKAAWEVYKQLTPTWELVTLCPPFVFGPILHEISSPDTLNTSNKLFYDAILSGKKTPEELAGVQGEWVDVRDVADAHVRAIEIPEVGGERIIISGGSFIWQDWFDAANQLKVPGVHVGTPGKGETFDFKIRYNTTKARSLLGMKFRTKLECAEATINDMKDRGW